jgi:hypothetical protein
MNALHWFGSARLVSLAVSLALSVPPPAGAQAVCDTPFDVDADGSVEPLTDGLLVLRSVFGFTGATLINGAVDLANCTRCSAPEIEAYLAGIAFVLDVDDSGELGALTDGLLVLRGLFGFKGATLVTNAVDVAHCGRCTAVAIEVYLQNMAALAVEPLDVWEPTTVPFDSECGDCEVVDTTDLLPHLGGLQSTFHYNEAIDDPIAQWGDCLASMLECFQTDGGVSGCAAAAECPAECKALYEDRAPAGADELTLLEVLNGVYVNCGAPCRPLEEVDP